MSSLALRRGRGLDAEVELWLAALFTAPELAAADLLLQLSVAGHEAAESSSSSSDTTYSSRRSESPCLEVLTSDEVEEQQEVEERVVEEPALSTELDRRATKRYRLVSDLYGLSALSAAAAKTKKRKRRHLHEDGSSLAPRGGGDH